MSRILGRQMLDNSVKCRELLEEVNAQVKQIRDLVGEQIPDRMETLGSPKYDNTRNIITNTPILPEAGLTRIRKPDGSRKKVILYYTSISMLLRCEDQMLKKMKHVFRVFLERKDDITLLWHSHPLTEAAISAMRSRMLEEYRKMVEEYKAEGWGIYDDSPELDRVGALCDAYYGDYSRLAQMCREAGKPIMIQCVDIM